MKSTRNQWIVITITLLAYSIWRVWMIPGEPLRVQGFSHDSAYLSMVARNVMEGRGYVLDALWLVFLQPASMPMPYHNCNPLQPALISLLGQWTGQPVAWLGFVIPALASALLWLASTFLLLRYFAQPLVSFAIALGVILFPPVWRSSWTALTDELWLAFMVAFLACLVRTERRSMVLLAGCFWGVAWLVRSTAVLGLAGAAVWLALAFGWRGGLRRLALLMAVAVVICSPWMLHNYRVWGNPVRSDDSSLLSLAAYSVPKLGIPFPRGFHLPDPPEPFVSAVLKHPDVAFKKLLTGARFTFPETLRGAVNSDLLQLSVLALLAVGLFSLRPRPWKSTEGLVAILYASALLGLFAILGPAFEYRYAILIYTLFALWLFSSLWRVLEQVQTPLRLAGFLLGTVYLAMMAATDLKIVRSMRDVEPVQAEFLDAAVQIDRQITHGKPVVVGPYPYFYSLVTRANAFAIPEANDDYLRRFLGKYNIRYLVLSDAERDFWHPDWRLGVPEDFQKAGQVERFVVYQWNPPPTGKFDAGKPDMIGREKR